MGDSDIGGERPTVLVVDDDPEMADLYAELLAEEYTTRTAYSGEEALDPDHLGADVSVVLLDRRMEGTSGDEVLRTIRARGIGCRVVMVTAIKPDTDVLDLPFDDYLVKPVTGEILRDAVSRMIVRNSCDETIRGIVALASKMATLEAKMTLEELESSGVYAALDREFRDLRRGVDMGDPNDDVYTEFTAKKVQTLFE
ncbi:HalX domain-containing protein [Halorubrum aquaticum]|uniref:HalX domain-containing protein n=1 Tax=Halorubrum aquaticum TaxID=387340 RepID=A0A1I3C5I2_9EURY|nr:response regulator [Halorubrum aquaticum]SFH69673.1 HalX domain-containing protein [Halorubrum aquaticum]